MEHDTITLVRQTTVGKWPAEPAIEPTAQVVAIAHETQNRSEPCALAAAVQAPQPLRQPQPALLHPALPLDVKLLGNQIAELSARIDAATYELLCQLREFDHRYGWEGFRSCAHWLNWRTGLDLGAAREKLRVAAALADLDHISAAMARGKLSYSKVRALTRVATPATEARLLAVALSATAAQVERLVRAWRRADRDAQEDGEQVLLASRTLSMQADEDGMVVLRGRLPAEVGAVLLRAVEAALEQVPVTGDDEPSTTAQRRADALGLVAESALVGGLDPGNPGDRFQVTVHVQADALAAGESASREPTVVRSRVSAATRGGSPALSAPGALDDGLVSAHAGVERGGGVDASRTADSGVGTDAAQSLGGPQGRDSRSDSCSGESPACDRPPPPARRDGEASGIASEAWQSPRDARSHEDQSARIAGGSPLCNESARCMCHAKDHDHRRVATACRTSLLEPAPIVVAHVSAERCEVSTTAGECAAPETDVDAGQAVIEQAGGLHLGREAARRVACDAGLVVLRHAGDGEVLDVGRRTRAVPTALRRALQSRDHSRCQFPGCDSRHCDAHHVEHWADGGATRLTNLVSVCRFHHRAVHEEGFRVVPGDAKGQFRFLRPDGEPMPGQPPAVTWEGPPLAPTDARLAAAGIRIGPDTATPEWYGESLHLQSALDVLWEPPAAVARAGS